MNNSVKSSLQSLAVAAARIEEIFLCLLLTAMIILACLQIILRGIFSGGLLWADPVLRYLVLWTGMFGASAATRHGRHITIDIISYLIPAMPDPWLKAFINFFSASVSCVLTYAAIIFVVNEAAFGGRELLGIPSWGWNLVFPLAFFLITLLAALASVPGLF